MGIDEVKLALVQKRFNQEKEALARHWLEKAEHKLERQQLSDESQSTVLRGLIGDFEALIPKFVQGQFGVLFLPTEKEVEFQSLLSEARALLREQLGAVHEFTLQLLRIDTASNFSDGASVKNVQEVIAVLKGVLRTIERREVANNIRLREPTSIPNATGNDSYETEKPTLLDRSLTKIFIVHGHDHGPREAVARFIERLGFEPVILDEQANRNRTIIEKLEGHSDVGFAIVLLTPDDEGRSNKDKAMRKKAIGRARQNVILELGYFVGLLGRTHVCALAKRPIDLPSDYSGVLCDEFDDQGAWKQKLARELEAAGYSIDWAQVMK